MILIIAILTIFSLSGKKDLFYKESDKMILRHIECQPRKHIIKVNMQEYNSDWNNSQRRIRRTKKVYKQYFKDYNTSDSIMVSLNNSFEEITNESDLRQAKLRYNIIRNIRLKEWKQIEQQHKVENPETELQLNIHSVIQSLKASSNIKALKKGFIQIANDDKEYYELNQILEEFIKRLATSIVKQEEFINGLTLFPKDKKISETDIHAQYAAYRLLEKNLLKDIIDLRASIIIVLDEKRWNKISKHILKLI